MKRVVATLALLLLALVVAAAWYLWAWPVPARILYTSWGLPEPWLDYVADWLPLSNPDLGPAPIVASGTIEAEEVIVASEVGQCVAALYAGEGDEVRAGALLVQLDETDVLADLAQGEAAVEVARANLVRVRAGPRGWETAAAEAAVDRAEQQLEGASTALRHAEAMRADPQDLAAQVDAASSQVQVMAAQVEQAKATVRMAEIVRDSGNPYGSDREKTELAGYEKQLEAARERLSAAEAAHRGAQRLLLALQAMREDPLALDAQVNGAETQVGLAKATLEVAEAELAALRAGPRREAIALAEAQVRHAEASLELLRAQREKLALRSPMAGLVTRQIVEAGETAMAGQPLLTITDLHQVELAVYVSTDRIGRVGVGQAAEITVESVPGRVFTGQVTYIAAQAEFTPRRVQTQEQRARTVFEVKITLPNPDLVLKPGMPADAEFVGT
jgi:multidrug efflux pump subunit AcrA (membrane-fusion protein)